MNIYRDYLKQFWNTPFWGFFMTLRNILFQRFLRETLFEIPPLQKFSWKSSKTSYRISIGNYRRISMLNTLPILREISQWIIKEFVRFFSNFFTYFIESFCQNSLYIFSGIRWRIPPMTPREILPGNIWVNSSIKSWDDTLKIPSRDSWGNFPYRVSLGLPSGFITQILSKNQFGLFEQFLQGFLVEFCKGFFGGFCSVSFRKSSTDFIGNFFLQGFPSTSIILFFWGHNLIIYFENSSWIAFQDVSGDYSGI